MNILNTTQTEKALRESEERFRKIFEDNPFGIAMISVDGIILRVNHALKNMLGYSDIDVLNHGIAEFIYEADLDPKLPLLNKLVAGEIKSFQVEKRYVHKNGSLMWAQVTVTLMHNDDGKTPYAIAIVEDISKRKEAENALHEREQLLSAINKNLSEGIYRSSADGRFVYVNDAYIKLFGYDSFEDLQDHRTVELFADPNRRSELIERVRNEKRVANEEVLFMKKNGETFWGLLSSIGVFDESDELQYFDGAVKDITSEKLAQKALREQEQLLSAINHNLTEGICRAGMSGEIIYANKAFVTMFGFDDLKDLQLRSAFELYADPLIRKLLVGKLEAMHSFENEQIRYRKKDGSAFWGLASCIAVMDEEGDMLYVDGAVKDITEIKLAEEAFRASEEKFRLLFERVPAGVYQSSPEGKMLAANPAMQVILGYDSEAEIRQLDITTQLYADPAARRAWMKELDERGSVTNCEVVLKRKDGKEITLLESVHAVKDERGKILYYEGTAIDITSRKQAEAAMMKAKEAAESANRSKTVFLANMSHEIRTPLNIVYGMASLLQGSELNDEQQELVGYILQSSEQLTSVINDILEISKIEEGKMVILNEKCSIKDELQSTLNKFEVLANQKNIDYRYSLDANIPNSVICDAKKIMIAVNNFVGNAIKFTENGSVEVTTKVLPPANHHITLRLTVKDTGIGIREEDFEKLFQKFSQLDQSLNKKHQGTGLGLIISKSMIEAMGGSVGFASEYGKGSEFYFELPMEVE